MLSGNVPHSVAEEGRRQLQLADEYESVSDYIANLDKFDRKLRRDGFRFTESQRKGLAELNRSVAEFITQINQGFEQKNPKTLIKCEEHSQRIRNDIKQLRKQHLEDLSTGDFPPLVSVAFLAALNAYSRVRDHSRTIAEIVSGEK